MLSELWSSEQEHGAREWCAQRRGTQAGVTAMRGAIVQGPSPGSMNQNISVISFR